MQDQVGGSLQPSKVCKANSSLTMSSQHSGIMQVKHWWMGVSSVYTVAATIIIMTVNQEVENSQSIEPLCAHSCD